MGQGAPEAARGAVLKGVYATRGTIAADRLEPLIADPKVFLADIMANIVRQELAAEGVPGAKDAVASVEPVFWTMEDTGLDQFKSKDGE